ncbi:MAG: hypothetical protein LBH90_06200 [Tannerella sp.]|jgi:uncharacterized membrane protein|nr:hypothetical protein [Tannerella sp.]
MENVTPTPNADDIANNKVMAILAYFGILFIVPLLAAKDSPFARFHANQGLVLFIGYIVVYIFCYIVLMISPTIGLIANSLLFLGLFVLAILGIINAAKGEMKELPVIGKFKFLK